MTHEQEQLFAAIELFSGAYARKDIAIACRAWLENEGAETPKAKTEDRLFKKKDIRAAWKRQRSICPECNGILIDPNLNSQVEPGDRTVGDHFQPHSAAGKTVTSNLRAIHARENSRKSDKGIFSHSKSTGRLYTEMIHDTNVVSEDDADA